MLMSKNVNNDVSKDSPIKPGPNWWEASALTTTPPLLSMSLKVEAMFFTFTSPWAIELKTIYGAQCMYLPQQVRPKFN